VGSNPTFSINYSLSIHFIIEDLFSWSFVALHDICDEIEIFLGNLGNTEQMNELVDDGKSI
jgi:hypothetical protein